jgi:catalase
MELPEAIPRAAKPPAKPEVRVSKALSLTALPGDGGIATRQIAILMANGVDGGPIGALLDALHEAGAVVRLLGSRLGTIKRADGGTFEVDATLENSPSVLFDALVLPAGAEALSKEGHALEFLKDQYRHCKTILVLGEASRLLQQAGIESELPSGEEDSGLLIDADAQAFIAAVAKHRHPARDSDPPQT